MVLMRSVAFTDIFCASSPTETVSGMLTSRTTGAVGFSKAWRVGAGRIAPRNLGFFLRRPLFSLATWSSVRCCRDLSSFLREGFLAPGFDTMPGSTGSSGTAGGTRTGTLCGSSSGSGSGAGSGSCRALSFSCVFLIDSSFSRCSCSTRSVSSSSCCRRFASSCSARLAASMRSSSTVSGTITESLPPCAALPRT